MNKLSECLSQLGRLSDRIAWLDWHRDPVDDRDYVEVRLTRDETQAINEACDYLYQLKGLNE